MPMTRPSLLTSGPPESPGWIGALVWIIPVRISGFWPVSSAAVICCPSAVTVPVATAGAPPRPWALPRAVTLSPMCTIEESPIGAVDSPDAP